MICVRHSWYLSFCHWRTVIWFPAQKLINVFRNCQTTNLTWVFFLIWIQRMLYGRCKQSIIVEWEENSSFLGEFSRKSRWTLNSTWCKVLNVNPAHWERGSQASSTKISIWTPVGHSPPPNPPPPVAMTTSVSSSSRVTVELSSPGLLAMGGRWGNQRFLNKLAPEKTAEAPNPLITSTWNQIMGRLCCV